jgi:ketosteroid isomerase-like protein
MRTGSAWRISLVSQENVEAVRRGLDAFARRDVDALAALSSAGIEIRLVGVVGEPVCYRGVDGIRQYFEDVGGQWASLSFEIEEIRDLGDQILAIGTERALGRASGAQVHGPGAFAVTFEGGLVTAMQAFVDRAEALEAVGLEE